MILSILTPTTPDRVNHLNNLRGYLGPLPEGVEHLTDDRGKHVPTGTKRNDLIQKAQGEWVVSIDDDDWVRNDYISLILEALKSNPDCVTFQGWYTENGRNKLDWTIKLGEKYEARTQDGKYQIYRWPNHLAVIRRSIAASVRFKDIWKGEDFEWSREIMSRGLLKTEVHIPEQIYHYIFMTNK